MYDKWFGKDPIFRMDAGSSFKYKKKIWEVQQVHEYTWSDSTTIEYKVLSEKHEAFLEVEDDDGDIVCLFGYVIQKHQLLPDFSFEDFEGEDILAEIEFVGNRYQLEEIEEGSFKNRTTPEGTQRLTSFTFYNKDDFISIAQWEDGTMEYSEGREVSRKKIKNIESPSSGHSSDNNLFS